ncbi:MAG: tRNA (adenosine(37)-N6)-threonylcarbamoyltransferase complex dimerization subunit type 1 TsaB [Pseudomonadales bacterium]|nr:tRNA (adenosine(37)-N6)-threonylcarbamoyltransferase complex dimerization subunit type 1 TsaB [Pseudomonadales bacterium]MDG1442121.1 tRNA (adenosine(37)-N6)-threonylcarbamoyltransferase complex dimerization subunit type 1 TsaB [Pseudomonadales bacterium]
MNILAIDTSTPVCMLGLKVGDELFTNSQRVDRTHSKVVLPRILGLLQDASIDKSDIDLIVYGQGPGSFTGLRIGVGVVQGFGFGLGVKVVGVSSMAGIAQTVMRKKQVDHVLVALTARNKEVYFGSYSRQKDIAVVNGSEGVWEASDVPVQSLDLSWSAVGSGWNLIDELSDATGVVPIGIELELEPMVEDFIVLGQQRASEGFSTDAIDAIPEYLREQVATPPKKHS